MRVALAAMLFTEPDLLLLDEPTNYLDLEGTLWLEDYLRDYPHTVLIVSHDRELLNRSVTSILHLAQGKLTLYTGGYDQLRGGAAREAAPRPQAQEEAGRRAPPHRGVHHPLQGQGLQGQPGAEPRQGAGAHAADRRADRGAGGAVPVSQPGQGLRQPADPAGGRRRRLRRRASRCCRAWTCASTPTTASACSAPTATARARSPS